MEKLSVGSADRRIDLTDRVPLDELLRVFQRDAAGRAPLVPVASTSWAVGPAVFVHGQGIVRFGTLMFCTSAHEVDAIVHLTDLTQQPQEARHPFR